MQPNELAAEKLLTRTEVQEAFGWPTKRFLELNRERGPTFMQFGRTIRYRAADVRAWLDEHRVDPAEAA